MGKEGGGCDVLTGREEEVNNSRIVMYLLKYTRKGSSQPIFLFYDSFNRTVKNFMLFDTLYV